MCFLFFSLSNGRFSNVSNSVFYYFSIWIFLQHDLVSLFFYIMFIIAMFAINFLLVKHSATLN